MVRITWQDPGRKRDGYGFLGATVSRSDIQLLNAKYWIDTDTTIVADQIASITNTHHFDYHYCETNNQGHVVIDLLRRYHRMRVQGITTSKNLTNKELIRKGTTMDKNTTAEWVEWARYNGIIKMPKRPWSPGIIELNKQLARFVMKKSGTGIKYEAAEQDDHDDLVMCLLGICHVAKHKFLRLGNLNANLLTAGITDRDYYARLDPDTSDMVDLAKEKLAKRGITPDDVSIMKW